MDKVNAVTKMGELARLAYAYADILYELGLDSVPAELIFKQLVNNAIKVKIEIEKPKS